MPSNDIDAVRADGGLVHIRPVREGDRKALLALNERASDQSIFYRFFTLSRHAADDYVERLLRPASVEHQALVALVDDELVGVAAFERLSRTSAEIALLVDDNDQHEGIGTLLIEHLASIARRHRIQRFVAEVLAENAAMIRVIRNLGFATESRLEYGVVRLTFDLEASARVVAAIDDRERVADAASLRPLLAPQSVAVIGASARPKSVGHEVLRNILASGFTGTVNAVNPKHDTVLGIHTVASAHDLPVAPDLAVVAVPAASVLDVVHECGECGARGIVLLSSGFGETGAAGEAMQHEVVAAARRHGMRVIGPNCLGVINTDPDVSLNATFASVSVNPGHLGLVSQSGALGIAVLLAAKRCGLGVSQFVSVGNKADISGNDLLLAWERDERTSVIALYLESFGNPRKFSRIARRVSRHKPIIAIKAGRSASGQRAGQSHTAAAASSDAVVGAMFAQAGVLRVDTMEEMLDVARVLSDQPLAAGPRLAIVGNSGGPGILAADAAEAAGLTVVELVREDAGRPARRRSVRRLLSEPGRSRCGRADRGDRRGTAHRAGRGRGRPRADGVHRDDGHRSRRGHGLDRVGGGHLGQARGRNAGRPREALDPDPGHATEHGCFRIPGAGGRGDRIRLALRADRRCPARRAGPARGSRRRGFPCSGRGVARRRRGLATPARRGPVAHPLRHTDEPAANRRAGSRTPCAPRRSWAIPSR